MPPLRLLRLLLLLLALACATGGVRAASYVADASAGNASSYPWIDISATGTSAGLGDDTVSATITPGFTISFGGSSYTGLRIMSNGQVQFGGSDTKWVNSALPLDGSLGKANIDAVMLPLWDDLSPSLGGAVRYQTTGTAPNRVFVVSWLAVPYYGSGYSVCTSSFLGICLTYQTVYSTATFQVQIHEQGFFVYRYASVEGNGGAHGYAGFTNAGGATIGFEVGNSDYVQFSRNSATVAPDTTIVWSNPVSLRAQWDFETFSGATTPDSSGNGNTLSLGASGVTQGNGAAGSGMTLGGAFPAAGSSAGATVDTTGSYTVEAWVRFTSMTACMAQSVVSQDATTVHPFEIALIPNCGLPQPLFFEVLASDADSAASTRVFSTFTPVVNTWYHVAGVRDAAAGTIKFYVNCVLQGTATTSAKWASSGPLTVGRSRFSASTRDFLTGTVDVVKVWTGALTAAQVSTECVNMPRNLLAEWKFEQTSWNGTASEVLDTSGSGYHATAASLSATKPGTANTTPAIAGSPGTCRYGTFNRSNKDYIALPSAFPNLGSTNGFTVTAWIRTTDNTQPGQRIFIDDETGSGFSSTGWIFSLGDRGTGKLNFFSRATSNPGPEETITPAVIANNTWYMTAVGVNFDTKTKFISVWNTSGTLLSSVTTTYTSASLGIDSGIASIGGETNAAGGSENNNSFGFGGNIDDVRVYNGALTATELAAVFQMRSACAALIDHLEIQHASGTGLTCSPSTVTIRACQDAACTTPYTGGITGSLTATGTPTVVFPGGAPFSIGSGSSSTTEDLQVTSAGSVVLGLGGLSITPASSATCNFGSPSCTFTAADSGLLFDVPNHVAEVSQTVNVTAVRKSDNAAVCVPAFASVSKNITFACSYTNPSTGTLPVRVGGSALNAANSSAAACDAGGRAVSLAFNASGVASTTVQYADVGRITLTGSYSGSGSDAGLAMTGSDSFIAAPASFAFSGITAAPIKAGSNFSATVTARNNAGATTPNFGRETSPEGATLAFTKRQPTGAGAANGTFAGALGSFSSGVATAAALTWSEVGTGDLTATLASGSYLGSGLTATGTTGSGGAVGRFIPHHFDVTTSAACGSFSYAGQPFGATITARNAAGGITVNYDGTASTTPNFAKAVTLSEATALGVGSLSGSALAASAFSAGVAPATPSYNFTSKTTAAQSLALRATDTDAVSSSGFAEGTMGLRSGRLRVANGFGAETQALRLAVLAEYWSGNAWVINGADSCTSVPAAAVVKSNQRDRLGNATSAWTTTASAITLGAGNGLLTLSAPGSGNTGSLDLALNLGATTADQSCLASHPASTGAALPWLRSRNGSCAATWDRDPSARASFGIFSPETKKTVHVREIF